MNILGFRSRHIYRNAFEKEKGLPSDWTCIVLRKHASLSQKRTLLHSDMACNSFINGGRSVFLEAQCKLSVVGSRKKERERDESTYGKMLLSIILTEQHCNIPKPPPNLPPPYLCVCIINNILFWGRAGHNATMIQKVRELARKGTDKFITGKTIPHQPPSYSNTPPQNQN